MNCNYFMKWYDNLINIVRMFQSNTYARCIVSNVVLLKTYSNLNNTKLNKKTLNISMVKHLYCNIEYKKQLERIVVVCCHLLILNGNAVAPSLKRRHVTVNSLELSFVLNKFIFFSYVNINIWRHYHSKGARRKMQIDFSDLGSNWDQLWWYSAIYW